MTTATLDAADIATIVAYFVIVMAVGIIATVRAKRGSTKGFFLAGKTMTWLPIAGSIWATNMGAPMFVGLAGSAAANGFAPVMFEWHATYCLILLGWLFVPVYIASGCYTMPEYFQKRFGGQRLRVYYAMIQLLLQILSGISGEIYAGSLFIRQLLGWDIYLSTVLILLVTAIYTIGGGLAAVIYTDALQAIILVIGSVIVAVVAMNRIGGYESLVERYKMSAANSTYLQQSMYSNISCGFTPPSAFHIFQDLDSPYPWPGLVFGLTILATYYFCNNQNIVQRNLAAKNISHSKAACVLTSYLKMLPFFLFIMPGMISRILYPEEIGCADPDTCYEICGNRNGCSNIAYPLLVLRILPSGVKGLMLAALLAALMSSLTSIFNSASTMFSLDVWKFFRKSAGEHELVIVGRICGIALIGLSIAWLPILQAIQGSQLWDYLQAISSYINPPWVVVYILGIFWTRTTEMGAFAGLMVGLVAGLIRMIIHFSFFSQPCGSSIPDDRPSVLTSVHYMHFAIILAVITAFVTIAVSLVTEPRPKEKLHRVTWWTRKDELEPELTDDEGEEEEEEKKLPEVQEKPPKSTARKIYDYACGFSDEPAGKMTAEERREMTNIDEDPQWSRICNINAVIVVALTCFLIGFYA